MAGVSPIVTDGFKFTPSLIVTRGFGAAAAVVPVVVVASSLPFRIEPVQFMTPFVDMPMRTVAPQFWQPWITKLITGINRILARLDSFVSTTYTPTLTNTTNLDASTPLVAHYMRIGNEVAVIGQLTIDPTAAGATATEMGISLPVTSDFTSAANDITGFAYSTDSAIAEYGSISGDTTNNRAKLSFKAASSASHNLAYQFTYTVK